MCCEPGWLAGPGYFGTCLESRREQPGSWQAGPARFLIGNFKTKIRHEPSQAVKAPVRLTGLAPFIQAGPYTVRKSNTSILGKFNTSNSHYDLSMRAIICPSTRDFTSMFQRLVSQSLFTSNQQSNVYGLIIYLWRGSD